MFNIMVRMQVYVTNPLDRYEAGAFLRYVSSPSVLKIRTEDIIERLSK